MGTRVLACTRFGHGGEELRVALTPPARSRQMVNIKMFLLSENHSNAVGPLLSFTAPRPLPHCWVFTLRLSFAISATFRRAVSIGLCTGHGKTRHKKWGLKPSSERDHGRCKEQIASSKKGRFLYNGGIGNSSTTTIFGKSINIETRKI